MNQQERNQARNQLEYDLQYRLNNVIEQIKNRGITQISQAQALYNDRVEGFIRKTVIKAYDLGAEYVDSKLKLFVITEDELLKEHEAVKQLVPLYSTKFWRKVAKLIHRNDTLLQKYDFEPRSELNSNYMATSTAVGLVTKAIALGTIDKLKLAQNINPKLKGAATEDKVQWNALNDNNTCDPCAELDGEIFNVDDAPLPGDVCDGGDNCRCQLDIIEADESDSSEFDYEDIGLTANEFT